MLSTGRIVNVFSLMKGLMLIIMLSLAVPFSLEAQTLGFRSVFGSNMVLPHSKPITLSGYALPDMALTLEVEKRLYKLKSDSSGKWKTQIAPLSAGGPYRIRLSDASGAKAVLENVLAGNVWLCSGQSNMAYPVAASIDQPDKFNSGHSAIRLFSVPLRADINNQNEFMDPVSWQTASDESVKNFSAVCYFFAREMIEKDGIPIGLINASWGGSAIEAWISEQGLNNVPEYECKVTQLQQYREDPRKAELAFASDWMQWWQKSSDQGPVWNHGALDKNTEWRPAPLQDWKTYQDERLKNHHGMLWFSRVFDLTPEQQAKKATFILGRIDEVDSTWINGKFVNNSFGYGTRREYPLETGVLQKGANQITVNVLNTWGAGGMTGPAEEVGIKFDDGEFLSLGTNWYYRMIPRETGFPPRSPWESVSGITGMFNGMIAPLQPLEPEGVIWYQGESNTETSHTYKSLLSSLVIDWRRHFNQNLLFIVVQLPNYGAVAATPVESGWATVRNAQQQVSLEDDLVGLVVTHDSGDDIDIHPKKKFIVGARAAQVAQALGCKGVADGVIPSIAGMDSNSVSLEFSPPLSFDNGQKEVSGFSICNESGRCVFAGAEQIGSRIKISLNDFKDASLLRYCWSDGGQCSLKAVNDLPVSSFEVVLKVSSLQQGKD
ncbi:MAG: hypothetical protein JXL81_11990 [Deltaproteobacteria bacterium]|nr:hypothetical protein [Deltaproteobacteria bacterium]